MDINKHLCLCLAESGHFSTKKVQWRLQESTSQQHLCPSSTACVGEQLHRPSLSRMCLAHQMPPFFPLPSITISAILLSLDFNIPLPPKCYMDESRSDKHKSFVYLCRCVCCSVPILKRAKVSFLSLPPGLQNVHMKNKSVSRLH